MTSKPSDNILIAGEQVGLERDIEPFLLPDGAYPILENMFILRERVKRKRAFRFFARFRRVIPSTTLNQTTTAGVLTTITDILADANIALRATEPDAEIEPGSVVVAVTGATPASWNDATTDGVLTPVGGNADPSSINYVTGLATLNFTGADPGAQAIAVTFNYFPALPAMGIRTKEDPFTINQEITIGFDTKYAYTISGVAPNRVWIELTSTAATTWQGSNSQFFWTTNFRLFTAPTEGQYLFATNFNYDAGTPANSDPIRFYNNTTWAALTPQLTGAPVYLLQAKVILPYKSRLLAFNTVEGTQTDFLGTNTRHPQRVRFCKDNVDPTSFANAWRSDIPGNGGFIDAPTGEAIVSAAFLKDNLVVYFERSSWLLVDTGNPTLPFVWKKINSELGAESTFSVWSFDEYAVGVGDKGFHICNGYKTERMDIKIPDEIFKFQNENDGPERVYAGRDYTNELLYFTYPQRDIYDPNNDNKVFPNRVMVYNYRNNSWSKNTDSFTCYGYFQRTTSVTWDDAVWNWEDATQLWSGEFQGAFIPLLMAGNQQGFTFHQEDIPTNDQSLAIKDFPTPPTATITSINHNLRSGDYITIEGIIGGGTIAPVQDVYQVQAVTDADNFTIDGTFSGSYLGGGRITVLQNFRIATKRINPYLNIRNTVRLSEIAFFIDRTDDGEFEAQLLIDENTSIPMPPFSPFDEDRRAALPADRQANIVLTRPETGMPFQANQEKIWHPKKFSLDAQFIQMTMTLNASQMQDLDIYRSDFILHALLFRVTPSGRLVL